MFLFSNLLGLGLGPVLVGVLSDQFASGNSDADALRMALSVGMLVLLPALVYYWRSASSLAQTATTPAAN